MEGRVVDPDTLKDVPKGTKGELWARGNVVTPGYFKDPKATAEIFTEPGWLRTGDLVLRDEFDRIHYLDRLKEMIKVKGLQVAATEVEDTLLAHPEGLVKDACVAGVDNGRGDGSLNVRAWVVLTPQASGLRPEELEKRLKQHVEKQLSRHKWLTGGVEVVESVSCGVFGNQTKLIRADSKDAEREDAEERDAGSLPRENQAERWEGETIEGLEPRMEAAVGGRSCRRSRAAYRGDRSQENRQLQVELPLYRGTQYIQTLLDRLKHLPI